MDPRGDHLGIHQRKCDKLLASKILYPVSQHIVNHDLPELGVSRSKFYKQLLSVLIPGEGKKRVVRGCLNSDKEKLTQTQSVEEPIRS